MSNPLEEHMEQLLAADEWKNQIGEINAKMTIPGGDRKSGITSTAALRRRAWAAVLEAGTPQRRG
jgi:hypothetical protein